ncbi:MAG: putative cilia- and flagella-associated protein 57 [Streblomastix strix]|uniref:Putative cilia-and flagella-associated protein 57 n=1 Tax=Streblomastix strix TaxID=222440 RepID=A0A5J4X7M8_9EUKA|nr:MAG: putative cilia- and flagella-associated protein 57 [Streblomastix strix]
MEQTAPTTLALTGSEKQLIVGLDNGSVRIYQLPLSDSCVEIPVHSGAITALLANSTLPGKMLTSGGSTHILSVSADGCAISSVLPPAQGESEFEIPQGSGTGQAGREESWADEIQVSRAAYAETMQALIDLEEHIKAVDSQREGGVESVRREHERKMKEITSGHEVVKQSQLERLRSTESEKQATTNKASQEMDQLRRDYRDSTVRIDEHTEKKQKQLDETSTQVEKEKRSSAEEWEKKMRELNSSHLNTLAELRSQFEEEIKQNDSHTKKLEEEIAKLMDSDTDDRLQVMDQVDISLLKLQADMEEQLTKEIGKRDVAQKEKKDADYVVMQKTARLSDMRSRYEEKVIEYQACCQMLEEVLGEIASLKKEIAERDDTIKDKAFRIQDLRQKNQELDKFKFVLDWKIQELQTKIAPREQEILTLGDQIKDMDSELNTYAIKKRGLELELSENRLNLEGLEKELGSLQQRLKTTNEYIKKVEDELHNALPHLDDPKELKEIFVKIYTQYVIRNAKGQLNANPAADSNAPSGRFSLPPPMARQVASSGGKRKGGSSTQMHQGMSEQREHERQRSHLERNVTKLKTNLTQGAMNHKAEIARIMHENVTLVKEINQLRRDIFNEEQKEKELLEEKRIQMEAQKATQGTRKGRGSISFGAKSAPGAAKDASQSITSGGAGPSGSAQGASGQGVDDAVLLSSVQRELMEQKQELDNLRRLVVEAEQARAQEIALLRKRRNQEAISANISQRSGNSKPNSQGKGSSSHGNRAYLPPFDTSQQHTPSGIRGDSKGSVGVQTYGQSSFPQKLPSASRTSLTSQESSHRRSEQLQQQQEQQQQDQDQYQDINIQKQSNEGEQSGQTDQEQEQEQSQEGEEQEQGDTGNDEQNDDNTNLPPFDE